MTSLEWVSFSKFKLRSRKRGLIISDEDFSVKTLSELIIDDYEIDRSVILTQYINKNVTKCYHVYLKIYI